MTLCNCKQKRMDSLKSYFFDASAIFKQGATDDLETRTALAFTHQTLSLVQIIGFLSEDCVCEKKSKTERILDEEFKNCVSEGEPTEAIIFALGKGKSAREVKELLEQKWSYCDQCDSELTESDKTYCKKCISVLSSGKFTKQPQSPCEHEWKQLQLWGCNKEKCGLVTCKNPSGSSINQNPNVST